MKSLEPKILITGGAGFLGKSMVREFLDHQSPLKPSRLIVFDVRPYDGLQNENIQYIQGDICKLDEIENACKDVDIVIHSAAIIDWGLKSKNEVLMTNVEGTKNVIHACIKNKVRYLLYTSSLDAVFTGRPLIDINEEQPYPTSHHTVYCESKKLAELAILEAHNKELKTAVLRPSDIYGEEDPYHIDSLIDMAKNGFYVRLGNGQSKCQHVYVGNMGYAHILLAKALWNGNKNVEKQIYFITDGKGTNFFKFFDQVVEGAGYKLFPRNAWIPKKIAFTIGSISEMMAFLVRPFKKYNPKFNRFAVIYTCTDFTFSSRKAAADFGFKPKYSTEEALQKTIAFYSKNN